MRLYEVSLSIVSDHGFLFTSHFWKALQHGLGIRLDLSTTFHPHINDQSKRTIQVFEDIFRASVVVFGARWA